MSMVKELERLVVRLVGDGSNYTKTLDTAVKETASAARKIDKITRGEMGTHNRAMKEAAAVTGAAAVPTRQYVKEVKEVAAAQKAVTVSTGQTRDAMGRYTKEAKQATAIQDKMTGSTNGARDAMGRFVKTTNDASGAHTKGGNAAKSHGSILNYVGQIVSAGTQKLGAYASAMQGVGKSMGIVGAIMGVAVTLPVMGAGAAILKMGADAETTRTQFEVMLGRDQGRGMLENIKKFAAETPFQFPELAASARTLIGFGIETEKIMDTMKLLGDVSAGTGKDIKELSVIFGQVKSMGKLQGQDLLQLTSAGIGKNDFAQTMGLSMADFTKEMEAGNVSFEVVEKTFKRLTSEGGRFNNMMGVLSKTTTGTFSTLMDNMGQLGANLGEYLLPTANKIIDWAAKAVIWFDNLGPAVHKTVMFIVGFVGILGPLLSLIGGLVIFLTTMGTTLSGIIVAGLGVVATLAAWAFGIALVIKAVQVLVDKIYGEGSFVTAIKAALAEAWLFTMKLVGFFLNIGTNWKLLVDWMGRNWLNILKDMGMIFVTVYSNNLKNLVVVIGTMVRLWVLWQGFMIQMFKSIFTAEFVDWVLTGVIEAIGIFIRFVDSAWQALQNLFTGGGTNQLADLAGQLGERLAKDFKEGMTTDSLMTSAADILKEQAGKLNNPLEGFKSSLEEMPDFVLDMNSNMEKTPKELEKAEQKVKVMALEDKKEKKKKKEDEEEDKRETPFGAFKSMSLKQFAVDPIVNTYRAPKKKQEVSDEGVQNKLDEVISAVKGQGNVAVMGR